MGISEPQLRLAEIEVSKSPLDEKIIGIFRYESENRGKRGPVLVILAEIASTLYVYEQLLDVVNASAEQVRHLVSAVDTDPMARFEKLIQRLNEAIADFLIREPAPVAWNRVNMFVLEISGEHVCISGLGRLTNILLQKQTDGTYRSFDLFGSLEQPADIQPQKPFAALICGELHAGDILFAGTSNFERLRQELQISQRLKTLPPVTAALEIQQDIERQEIPDDFAALVMANVELPNPETLSATTPASSQKKNLSSIERMYQEEQKTQAMLGPTLAPLTTTEEDGPRLTQSERLRLLAARAQSAVVARLRSLLNRRRPIRDPVTIASLRGMSAGHGSFITRKHKTIMVGIVGAVILLGGGTLWYRFSQRASAEQAAWDAAYRSAMEKRTQAETEMVYGNEDHSLRLIKEAEDITSSLDQKTSARRANRAKLETALGEVLSKLKHEMRVDQPTEVLALSGDASHPIPAVGWSRNRLVAFDPNTSALLIVDPVTHSQKRIPWPTGTAAPKSASAVSTGLLFIVDPHTALRLETETGQLAPFPMETQKAMSVGVGLAYSRRFYLLDPASSMIWRYALGSSIAQETPYLKQTDTPLAQATAMTIDTSVYIGLTDGQLIRYLSGLQEAWSPALVEPRLTNITSLWTTTETDRLVVADATGKRILVFRKDGKLIAQIVSAALQNPRLVTGDDKQKKIYVADGTHVWSFDLP